MPERSRFAGVLGIVRYNWPFYLTAVVILVLGLLALLLPFPFWIGGLAVLPGTLWFLVGSLVASHWVYDRSPLYQWQWLEPLVELDQVKEALICVSGFDEVSGTLSRTFPEIHFQVLDHYDRKNMTEASIHRARKAYPPGPDSLEVPGHEWPGMKADLVLAPLSIHEFRHHVERTAWFRQARQSLREDGPIVLIEHVRDLANFIAFGPGFLHFHSFSSWEKSWREAGLTLAHHSRLTPFLRIIVLT